MTCVDLKHHTGRMALAMQFGDYRAACHEAIYAVRRVRSDRALPSETADYWLGWVHYTFCRRHRSSESGRT